MPIKVPDNLPAKRVLESEGLVVIEETHATRQDIRPLRIGLLNLMPHKQQTESQIARLIGATPLQIELSLVTTGSYVPGNVSQRHMSEFYRTFAEVRDESFDGFIVTGAPIETLPFDRVKYWDELCEIFEWTQTNVHSTMDICWGAQAAMQYFHGVPKHELPEKMFGVFPHAVVAPQSPYLRGFDDEVPIPVSRHTETRLADVDGIPGLTPLLVSDEAGLCMLHDFGRRHIYMLNHLEYDAGTLDKEYKRDVGEGLDIAVPKYYYPKDDPSLPPRNRWRSHAHLFIANWINETYQTTPYDVTKVGVADAPTLSASPRRAAAE